MEEVRPSQRPRVPALDGLRGVAVLLVLVHNAGSIQVQASSRLLKTVFFLHAPGWIGVHVFFVLSGFLITGVLLDARGPGALQTFWIRRAARIFPLSFFLLLLLTVLPPTLGRPDLFGPRRELWWYWTYLCNWGQPLGHKIPALAHFWSLAVEEQFYVLWPILALRCTPRTLLRIAIAAAVAATLLRVGLCVRGMTETVYQNTFTRMDALTLGGAAAIVARDGHLLDRVLPRMKWVVGGSVVVLAAMWPFTRAFNQGDPWVLTAGFAVLAVLGAALILQAGARPEGALARRLSAPWLCWFGKYSYAIYVAHFPILSVLDRSLGPLVNGASPARALAALLLHEALVAPLSVGAALVSWRVLEQPAMHWRERLRPHEV
jgi:peptidoglycan/LPS O-acetylase OafA/YrhL